MIVLDTNVISELLRPEPDPNVARWATASEAAAFHTTAICEAELLVGVALMPQGKRRAELENAIAAILLRIFPDRILPFNSEAARHYAKAVASRTALGSPIMEADAQIAAICIAHGASIVTRDARGFSGLGLDVVNPWTD